MTKQTVKPKNESTISYSGQVEIKIKKGKSLIYKKTISNMGTLNMFLGIANALSLINPEENNYIPRYLGVGYFTQEKIKVDTNEMGGEIVRAPLKSTTTIENISGTDTDGTIGNIGKKITFNALLPYSIIGSSSINELGLFGTDFPGESLLARIW